MRKRVSIKALQAFEAAARLGSFATAAEDLGLTPSAISHQVKILEEQLGLRLFHRVHRSVALTDDGRAYAAEIIAAFARIDTATRNVTTTGSGTTILTVRSMPSFAAQWLMPRLGRVKEIHPAIDIRLRASVSPIDLTTGAVDVDIRYNPGPPPAGCVLELFPDDVIAPMCSPALANGLNPIRKPSDISRHILIHSEINIVGWRDWANRHRGVELDMERGLRFDRSFMAINAAANGMGVCLDSLLLARQELLSGRLIVPFPTRGLRAQGHGFVTLKSTANLPKIRLFREWLFSELEAGRQWEEEFLSSLNKSA
ncbi:LysR family transcriptional regulator [Azospirillum argentinense]|uniref:LysR family transcriptional regulator n=2 Tax=Azospirillum TaxID=191 RepID=A0A2K1FZG2_9PROT|nr:LysR substrate-binding domain-containing protein [Azospirillum argentinense]AIB12505.1 LysR family transcriptional regulator [Azospirillum argentinense]EZQ09312.1 LysR family transcriptional regulator [Azospirillum argentinense]KAA1056440.1 Glycine cleavage system transcriptional activator [Azospirillum argentinense]MBK3802453.1 LysR family transcriptional regulator [Azospirillum argentinense]PNQ97933.1 LysR family transcriptional regulator [Azospirillum argentinense]